MTTRDCLNGPENQVSVCLDSVFNDSRCPTGAYCIWAGNSTVRFKYEKYKNKPVIFDLNTNSQYRSDTIVDGYKFTLVGLSPYQAIGHQIIQKDYKAKIIVIPPDGL